MNELIDNYKKLKSQEYKIKDIDHRTIRKMLTKREYDTLSFLSQGLSNKKIGEEMGISEKTVKNHVSSILEKIGANDRLEAVVIAVKNNWIQI